MGDAVDAITAERIVELFEKNRTALKRFATLVASEDEVRLTLLSAVIRDVATRDYVDRKFAEMMARISSLEARVSRIEGQLALLIKLFTGFMIPVLVALIGILIRLVFIP